MPPLDLIIYKAHCDPQTKTSTMASVVSWLEEEMSIKQCKNTVNILQSNMASPEPNGSTTARSEQLHCLQEITQKVLKKWNLAVGCDPFYRIWKSKICTLHNWYLSRISMNNCFEFWKDWFCNHIFGSIYLQIKTDSAPINVSKKWNSCFCLWQNKSYYRYTAQSYRPRSYRMIKWNSTGCAK